MATDEPDSDPVSKGLEQLRTRSGSSYGVPPPSPSAARGRPRAAKASSAPADTRVGFGREEPAAEEGKSGGTVLASPAPEPREEEQSGRIARLEGQLAEVVGVLQGLTGQLEAGAGQGSAVASRLERVEQLASGFDLEAAVAEAAGKAAEQALAGAEERDQRLRRQLEDVLVHIE